MTKINPAVHDPRSDRGFIPHVPERKGPADSGSSAFLEELLPLIGKGRANGNGVNRVYTPRVSNGLPPTDENSPLHKKSPLYRRVCGVYDATAGMLKKPEPRNYNILG